MSGASPEPELSLVVPVFREASGAAALLHAWTAVLESSGIDYELRVYDDGSDDGTLDVLRACARRWRRIIVTTHENRGHGPTVRRGYEEARGRWVFQADGDDEVPAEAFTRFWERRDEHDLLLGRREPGSPSVLRRIVSASSSATVRLCFGPGGSDVNVPFRLMRGGLLRELLPFVPVDAFAPNVLLTGLFVRFGSRVLELPVPRRSHAPSRSSLRGRRLALGVVRSLTETVWVGLSARGRVPPSRSP